jgi:hypothetical protein
VDALPAQTPTIAAKSGCKQVGAGSGNQEKNFYQHPNRPTLLACLTLLLPLPKRRLQLISVPPISAVAFPN